MRSWWAWALALVLSYLPVGAFVAHSLGPTPSLLALDVVEDDLDPSLSLADPRNRAVIQGVMEHEQGWLVQAVWDRSMFSAGLSPEEMEAAERCMERSRTQGTSWTPGFRCMSTDSLQGAVKVAWYNPWWVVPLPPLGLVVLWLVLAWHRKRDSRILVDTMRRVARGDLGPVPDSLRQSTEGRALLLMISALEEKEERLRNLLFTVSQQKEQLEKAHRALRDRERLALVGTLAAGVAHELGNPLASLMGILEVWEDSDDATRSRLLELMHKQLDRMDGLIRSLMNASRPSTGEIVALDVKRVVSEAWELVSHRKEARGVELELDCSSVVVRAPEELGRAFVNLFLNSVQAMGGSGRVIVRCRTEDGEGVIEVGDTGPGIPPDVRDRIFDPFFTTKAPDSGTGLGLTMVLGLVESGNGTITVLDRDEGAWFELRFPLA